MGSYGGKLIASVKTIDDRTISSIRETWKKISPDAPFEYSILDEDFNDFHKTDFNDAKLLLYSVSGILIVTCFGMIGFTYFSTQYRLKEIAIRKILGDSIAGIYLRWFKNLLTRILIASLVSIPVAVYFTNEWLNDFIYKEEITYSSIPLTLTIILFLVTISSFYNINRAASRNPIEILNCE